MSCRENLSLFLSFVIHLEQARSYNDKLNKSSIQSSLRNLRVRYHMQFGRLATASKRLFGLRTEGLQRFYSFKAPSFTMAPAADIVTLENFESKMPRWTPEGDNHLYAIVDMGSNGIRFSISDLHPSRARLLKCVYRERAAISLFDALNSNSESSQDGSLYFPEHTITNVSHTLARFYSIAVNDFAVPPSHVSVFATEAMRKAGNAASMLDAISSAAPGVTVRILAPAVETLFGSTGAHSGFGNVKGLFLDLGGGSVQLTYMDSSLEESPDSPEYEIAAAQAGQSLPFGAARFIRVLEGTDAAVKATEQAKLNSGMSEAFAKLKATFPSLRKAVDNNKGVDIYLCGGGFRGYGSMLMHNDPIQPYPIPHIGAYAVSAEFFRDTKRMRHVNVNHDGKIFGMSKRRRMQFPAIATVVESLINTVPSIGKVTFCAGGNREGALMMMFPRSVRNIIGNHPLYVLAAPESIDQAVWDPVRKLLFSALPANVTSGENTVFGSLDMSLVFAQQIWHEAGEGEDANAAHALHTMLSRDPSTPGITHLDRTLLALTICARWGANLGPVDKQKYQNLRRLAHAADPMAPFWADYIGACAAALAKIVAIWPSKSSKVGGGIEKWIRFEATQDQNKLKLRICAAPERLQGLEPDDLADIFKNVGKNPESGAKRDLKVKVTVSELR